MSKIALNDAQRDSHRATMQIHQETANRLISEGNWGAAKIALELALPHANAIADKAVKSRIFGLLNTVRAKHRKLQLDGTSGQDRESYSDTQDRESYTVA